jgi:hypothetical protein
LAHIHSALNPLIYVFIFIKRETIFNRVFIIKEVPAVVNVEEKAVFVGNAPSEFAVEVVEIIVYRLIG